jgi:SAM-dependent methyltransferase
MHPVAGPPDARLRAPDAYESIAAQYDRDIRGDEWMRRALHAHVLRVFSPGQRVLDVACGTGTDALMLASHGIAVVGIDGSAGMIEALQRRSEHIELIRGEVLRIDQLSMVTGPFDGAISSFAGLNTAALDGFAHDLAKLVRPGGRAILHLLNAWSLWEWLGALRRGRWLLPARERQFSIGGMQVSHQLYFAREAYAAFEQDFALRQTYGLGVLRPPHTVRRIPTPVVEGLEWLDGRSGGLPGLRNAGRFFVLDLERRA